MAINQGWEGLIAVDNHIVGHMNNWELNFAADALEHTEFIVGSSGSTVRERLYEPGLRSPTMSFSGFSEDTNTAQLALTDPMRKGSSAVLVTMRCVYDRTITAGVCGWTGDAVITGLTIGTPVDGVSPFSGTLQITGGLTEYNADGIVLDGILIGDLVVATTV